MKYISGEILTETGFEKGYIGLNKENIVEIGKNNVPKKPVVKGLIVPSFINFHTHIGDSFIKNKRKKIPRDIEKLVAPPKGLKHQLLRKANPEEIIKGMEKSLETMIKTGTKLFCDFRENGISGINQIKTSLKKSNISGIILSRPDSSEYNKKEIDLLLKNSNGIGISSISDWDYSFIKKIAKETKRRKKIFAIHASERIREDVDLILDLKPDFVVHMTKATESDLCRIKENKIPVAICPRSNKFFGMKPNYRLLKKTELILLIGTDNCMINEPNIIEEIKLIKRQTNIFSTEELLNMTTNSPRKVLNLSPSIPCKNLPADFVVLDEKSLKILYISKGRIIGFEG